MVIDELMGAVNRVLGRRAFTARLALDFRAPAPIDVDLNFRAWLHDLNDRKITIRAEGRIEDGVFVEAEALFIAAQPETD